MKRTRKVKVEKVEVKKVVEVMKPRRIAKRAKRVCTPPAGATEGARQSEMESKAPPEAPAQHGFGALTDDALVAICQHVHSAADLVRLSCASHKLRCCIFGSEVVWRELFRRQRGEAAFEAMTDLLRVHGNHVVHAFFAHYNNRPKGEGSGVWHEALIFTDEELSWRRFVKRLACMTVADRADGTSALEAISREAGARIQRAVFERRINEWLEGGKKNEEGEGAEKEEEEEEEEEEEKKEEDDEDDDPYEKLRRSEPKLKTEVQKKQVRMLALVTRIFDRYNHQCSDDYRGMYDACKSGTSVVFLDLWNLRSYETSAGNGQHRVTTCKVYHSIGAPKEKEAHKKKGWSSYGMGKAGWEYAVNDAREDNPACTPLGFSAKQMWHSLLWNGIATEQEEGYLTYKQFLYFLAIALELTHTNDREEGYTPLHSFIANAASF